MRQEISAGGVVFKKIRGKFYFLLLRDQNNVWTFPKGLVEGREDKRETARREIGEEVGLWEVEFFKELAPIQYWYRFKGDLIKKTVYYFLFAAKSDEEPEPQKEEGISQVRWFSPAEAWENVGYRKTNEKVLKEAFAEFNLSLKNNGMD